MTKEFHGEHFDEATLLKLEIFRGYVRSWLPVFLTERSFAEEVHIYDFFSGPGQDVAGNPGTPILIVEEIESCLSSDRTSNSSSVNIFLHFNDKAPDKISLLENRLKERQDRLHYQLRFSNLEFKDALQVALPSMKQRKTANLVIIDQFGIKEVDESIFLELTSCSTTDMLFFISSSTIRRFVDEGSIQKYIPIQSSEVREIPAKEIHRYICKEFYRKLIPSGTPYHLAPFSIQKQSNSNIYGIIFGSGNLLGLDKFLQVCWNKDQITGEANYDIDDDIIRSGQVALFEEHNVIKKQDKFEQALTLFIREHTPTNNSVYEFTLESGFLPKHAATILQDMAQRGILDVTDLHLNQPARKNSFYLSWINYKNAPRVRFELR